MKARLAILALAAAGALLTSGTPPVAEDYAIGDDVYTIPGADVRSFLYCQGGMRIGIYELTATDDQPWRYWLLLAASEVSMVDAVGPVRVDGADVTWLEHVPGEVAVVSVAGGDCDGAGRIGVVYRRWAALVIR
jgi:hypothetical protein